MALKFLSHAACSHAALPTRVNTHSTSVLLLFDGVRRVVRQVSLTRLPFLYISSNGFLSNRVWFELNGIFVLLAFIVIALIAYTSLRNTITLYKLHKDLVGIRTLKKEGRDIESESEEVEAEGEIAAAVPGIEKTKSQKVWEISGMEPSEAVYLVEEKKRITQPNEKFCYAMFGLEFVLLFLWPAITLFIISWVSQNEQRRERKCMFTRLSFQILPRATLPHRFPFRTWLACSCPWRS